MEKEKCGAEHQEKAEVHLSRQVGEENFQEDKTAWKGELDTGKVGMQRLT